MLICSKRLAWCAIILALLQVVTGQALRTCIKDVKYCFTVTLPEDDGLVHFRLEAPRGAGWLGLGIGEGMGGFLMVAWFDENSGNITLSQRTGEDGVQPWTIPFGVPKDKIHKDLQLLSTSGIDLSENKLVVEFTRPLNLKGKYGTKGDVIKRNKQTFAYAYCETNPGDMSEDAELPRHDYRGNIKVNFNSGRVETSQYDKLIISHGFLMLIAWLVVIPGAIFTARFARECLPKIWFKLHVGIQVFLAFPIVFVGSSLSYAAAKGLRFDSPHKIVGFVLFLGFFIQLAIGVIHHHLYDKNRQHVPWWTQLHRWLGRALAVLAAFQIPLGLKLYGAKMGYFYAYYVYLFVLIIAFSFLSFRLWKRTRGQSEKFKQLEES